VAIKSLSLYKWLQLQLIDGNMFSQSTLCFQGQMFLALHQIDTGISVDLQVPRNYFWVTETKTNIYLSQNFENKR